MIAYEVNCERLRSQAQDCGAHAPLQVDAIASVPLPASTPLIVTGDVDLLRRLGIRVSDECLSKYRVH